MPQMSPILWTILFILFTLLFLLFNILNYFNFSINLKSNKNLSKNENLNYLIWKW